LDPRKLETAFAALRIIVAALLLVHGITRVVLGGVAPFGGYLAEEGFGPLLGPVIAYGVTLYELLATWLLAFGPRKTLAPIATGFVLIYAAGVALVHWPHGWFVVGAGRNGMEYSALLIACLLLMAYVGVGSAKR